MLKDTVITLLSRVVLLALGITATVIISRVLGPDLKGRYNIALLVMNTASILVVFGFGSANVYLGAQHQEQLPALAGNSLLMGALSGGIALIGIEALSFIPQFQTYMQTSSVPLNWIRWIAFLLPLMLLYSHLREIARAGGDIAGYTFLNMIQTVINLTSLIILLFILDRSLQGAIEAWAISQVGTLFITVAYTLRLLNYHLALDWALFKRSLKFGMRLYLGNIAQFLNYRLDVFIVGLILTPAAVGIYTTATALAERLWDIPAAIRIPLMFHASARPQSAVELTARLCRVVAALIGLMSLVVALFAQPLIGFLFGADFLPAAPALVVLLPGIWLLSLGKLLAIHLASTGRPMVGTWAALASLIATIILDVILIPRIGILGAAAASSVAYAISTAFLFRVFARQTGVRMVDIIVLRHEDVDIIHIAIRRMRQRIVSKQSD